MKEFLYNTDQSDLDTLSSADVLKHNKLTPESYAETLRSSVKVPTVFMKRNPRDIMINNYNETIIKAWQANMDIQFVSNAYACIQYLVAYITKEEREMGMLLQAVSKEHSSQGIKEQMRKCAQAFTNSRTVSAQEATYRLLGLPLHKSDFNTVWIPTGLPHQRVRILKPKSLLQDMEDDEENIYIYCFFR